MVGKVAACNKIPSPAHPPANPSAVCGDIFRNMMNGVMAACANWDARLEDLDLIENAKQLLITHKLLDAGEFSDIQVRWCPLFNAEGQVPERHRLYLHPALKPDPISTAATLAHEMMHVRQFRRHGAGNFACMYSAQLLACWCQDNRHMLENEAYQFGDRALSALLDDTAVLSSLGAPPAGCFRIRRP
jgi:hypothetical protein